MNAAWLTGPGTNEGVNMSADTTTDQVTTEQVTTEGIFLTDAAALKVKTLLDAEGRDDLSLRIAVQPGGCSGLRYQLFFDDPALTVMS